MERPAASKSGILIQSVDEPDFSFQDLTASFKLNRKQSKTVVGPTNLELTQGEVLGIVGANGSGKSSLLWELQRRTEAVLVPQSASDLLFLPTVAHEFAESDRFAKVSRGKTASIFEGLVGKVDPLRHPRDLSAGMQLALAIAVQLVKESRLILLDEPTRGLDYLAKRELAAMLGKLQVEGKTLVIASHDRDFLQAVCGRVLRLQDGQLRQEITSYDTARHESRRSE